MLENSCGGCCCRIAIGSTVALVSKEWKHKITNPWRDERRRGSEVVKGKTLRSIAAS